MHNIITRAEIREVERRYTGSKRDMHPIMKQYRMTATRYWQHREHMINLAETLAGEAREAAYQLDKHDTAQGLKNLPSTAARLLAAQTTVWELAAAALEMRESCKVLGLIADA